MKISPEVSVIVPVYNVEKYLCRCIDSILAQSFSDFELILVDDGSPDRSGAICDEYAIKDARIRVIHQPNQGVSVARNQGVLASIGAYVMFIDGDDWVDKRILEEHYNAIYRTQAEICVSSILRVNREDETVAEFNSSEQKLSSVEAIKYLGKMNDERFRAPMAKLIRRDIAASQLFPLGRRYAEDMAVVYKWYNQSKSVTIIDSKMYFYRIHEASVTQKKYGRHKVDNLKTLEEMLSFFESNGYKELYRQFMVEYITNIAYQYEQAEKHLSDKKLTDYLRTKLRKAYRNHGKECGITLKKYPQCYNILYPRLIKVYWNLLGIWHIVRKHGIGGLRMRVLRKIGFKEK